MAIKILAVALFFAMGACSSVRAGAFSKGGATGIGARPLGMGGGFTTIADAGEAVFFNPAGLVQILRPEISGMGAVLFNGKENLFALTYVQPFGDQMAWALSTQQLLFTDGTQNERIYIGTFAAPLAVDKSISFGLNVKLLTVDSPTIPGNQATGFGIDMGFLYHLPILNPRYGKQLNIGLSVEDMDTKIRYQNSNEAKIPVRVRGGVSYEFTDDLVAAFEFSDFDDPNLAPSHHTLLLAGIEGWFFEDQLGLRTGYTAYQTLDGQFTAGISYRSKTWGIDYAYMGHAQFLGSTHRISASWRFGESFLMKVKSFIPEGVTAYVRGDIITLRWNSSPSISLAGYNIYFSKTSGGGYVKINQKPIKPNYYSMGGLEKNTRYYFVVTSVTNTTPPVESQYSREVLAGTTSAPGVPVLSQSRVENEGVIDIGREFGLASISLDGAKGFNIYMSEVSGGRFEKVNSTPVGNVPSHLVRKLKAGQKYYFTLTRVGADGVESARSKEYSFVAYPYSATLPNATAPAASQNK